jgi:hypothetical protein
MREAARNNRHRHRYGGGSTGPSVDLRYLTTLVHRASRQKWARSRHQ